MAVYDAGAGMSVQPHRLRACLGLATESGDGAWQKIGLEGQTPARRVFDEAAPQRFTGGAGPRFQSLNGAGSKLLDQLPHLPTDRIAIVLKTHDNHPRRIR